MEALFSGLIFITVALTSLAIGLLTSVRALREAFANSVFWTAVGVNTVVVPLVGWVVVTLLPTNEQTATGVVLCAICAAGPVGLKASQIARADLSWALSLTVMLLLLNTVTLPLWSTILVGESLTVRASDLLVVLLVAILLPVAAGSGIRRWFASRAQSWSRVATQVSNLTLVGAIAVGVAGNLDDLVGSLSAWTPLAAAAIVGFAGLLGRSLASDSRRGRATSLTTLNRATSVALLVIGRVFPEATEVFTAVVIFGLVQTMAALLLSLYWRRERVQARSTLGFSR